MKTLFTKALAVVGAFIATVATTGCWVLYIDEPEMPNEML